MRLTGQTAIEDHEGGVRQTVFSFIGRKKAITGGAFLRKKPIL